MWSFLVILYVVLVQNCHSIGLFYQNQQPQPQPQPQYGPVVPIQVPKVEKYQCTCTDGITTKIIPINENDERVGFITSYFTQPMQNMISSVKSYIQKPFEQNPMGMYTQSFGDKSYPLSNMQDFASNVPYFKQPGFGIGLGTGFGFGQGVPTSGKFSSDCLNSALGKLYGTSPCQMNMLNSVPTMKYQSQYMYPGMSSSIPGMPMPFANQYSQGNVRLYGGSTGFGANLNPNANMNTNLNTNFNAGYNGMLGMNAGVPKISVSGQVMQPSPTSTYINFKSNLPGANQEAGSSEKNTEGGPASASPSESESSK